MATENECRDYEKCGFVRWRIDRPDVHIAVLPENGDCGKSVDTCGRLCENIPAGINLSVESYGPHTSEEIELGFPEIPSNRERPRRLIGGGHE
jgi:hypothetical protein